MKSVFLTELAILIQLKSVRVILLVFLCVVVSLFAFAASECDSDAHCRHLLKIFEAKKLPFEVANRSVNAKNEHTSSFLPDVLFFLIAVLFSYLPQNSVMKNQRTRRGSIIITQKTAFVKGKSEIF